MAGTTVGEFVLSLVVDAGKGEITVGNLVSKMGELEVASVGEIAVLGELATKLAEITDAAVKTALGLHEFEAKTGSNSEALQQWESAARHTAAGAGVVEKAFLGISEQLEDIQRFGLTTGPIRNLVNTLKDVNFQGLSPAHPEELLKRIRDSAIFKKMSPADQFGILRHAGLGDMLELMQMSQKEFQKYSKETTPMSEREIEKYRKIHDSMATIEAIAANIKRLIADWASDATLAFLQKTADILKLELKSLQEIKDFMDKRKPGETAADRLKALAPEAKTEGSNLLRLLVDPSYREQVLVRAKESAVAESALVGGGPEVSRNTQVSMRNTVNINGSKLTEEQLSHAVKKVFTEVIQELPAQIDPGKKR